MAIHGSCIYFRILKNISTTMPYIKIYYLIYHIYLPIYSHIFSFHKGWATESKLLNHKMTNGAPYSLMDFTDTQQRPCVRKFTFSASSVKKGQHHVDLIPNT